MGRDFQKQAGFFPFDTQFLKAGNKGGLVTESIRQSVPKRLPFLIRVAGIFPLKGK